VGSIPTSGSGSGRRIDHVDQDRQAEQPERAGLTARERAVLEFEQSWWLSRVPKDQAVREQFQLTEAEYAVLLDDLIDTEVAMSAEPLLVRRLRRLRERRRTVQTARRTADQEAVR
jgi:hypothetical protein